MRTQSRFNDGEGPKNDRQVLAAVEEHVARRKLKRLLAAKNGVMLTKGDELF